MVLEESGELEHLLQYHIRFIAVFFFIAMLIAKSAPGLERPSAYPTTRTRFFSRRRPWQPLGFRVDMDFITLYYRPINLLSGLFEKVLTSPLAEYTRGETSYYSCKSLQPMVFTYQAIAAPVASVSSHICKAPAAEGTARALRSEGIRFADDSAFVCTTDSVLCSRKLKAEVATRNLHGIFDCGGAIKDDGSATRRRLPPADCSYWLCCSFVCCASITWRLLRECYLKNRPTCWQSYFRVQTSVYQRIKRNEVYNSKSLNRKETTSLLMKLKK
ncbi:hypothetical protein EVAR_39109_1 [Eumeta japonica]|uniref:Uncharacterized protein n=1 Tax=Eumeta variegata TaxID=151549 RepID=A0A4C1X5I8_EUMVA|nr:hypothetical protein EVAR_39109_1 [Eumeta japonica]